jgi:hypothetical protein
MCGSTVGSVKSSYLDYLVYVKFKLNVLMIHPPTKPHSPKPSVSLFIIVKQEFKILHSEKIKKPYRYRNSVH